MNRTERITRAAGAALNIMIGAALFVVWIRIVDALFPPGGGWIGILETGPAAVALIALRALVLGLEVLARRRRSL